MPELTAANQLTKELNQLPSDGQGRGPVKFLAASSLVAILTLGGFAALAEPPSSEDAAAAAFSYLVQRHDSGKLGPLTACAALICGADIGDFPVGLVGSAISMYPGLQPVSTCTYDADHSVYFSGATKQPISLIYCRVPPLEPLYAKETVPPDVTEVECGKHDGPLHGASWGFDVTRTAAGLKVVPNGKSFRE